MTISHASSVYRSAPQAQKDHAAIGDARRAQNNSAEQRAVAALRRDAPTPSSARTEHRENSAVRDDSRVRAVQAQARNRESVGTALDVKV